MNGLNLDFKSDVIEIWDCDDVDTAIWHAWGKYDRNVIMIHQPNSLLLSASPNSGIHIYFHKAHITDSLKAIKHRYVSDKHATIFLAYGYLPGGITLYQDVYCLQPGHYLKIDFQNGNIQLFPINLDRIEIEAPLLEMGINEACRRIITEKHTGSLWLALSGGLDSSILYSYLTNNAKEYSGINLELMHLFVAGGRNESKYLKMLLPEKFDSVRKIQMEEPDAWSAFICHANQEEIFGFPIILKYEYMMKKLREMGGQNVVMGDGPDDLFVCRATYEDYVDHDQCLFLPLRQSISNQPIPSGRFSGSREMNIWALYNFELQGVTNISFLHDAASRNGIRLIEPYLDQTVLNWCLCHARGLTDCKEKEPLKRVAQGLIPAGIINRKKMGYCSDFAIWNREGGLFHEYANHVILEGSIPQMIKPYLEMFRTVYREESLKKFNANQRTHGVGNQAFLFCFMLLTEFLRRH